MTKGPHRAAVGVVLAACLLAGITSCTASSRPAAAPAKPAQPTGRLILETVNGEIDEMTFAADGDASSRQIVAGSPIGPIGSTISREAAALSPDGTTLAYGDSRGLVLRNLQTGADTTLTLPDTTTVSCVNWAPDGRHLAVGTSDALYLSDQTGHMTSLYTVVTQNYTSAPIGSGGLSIVASSFTCGAWLNPTELVFQQSGPFPDTLSQGMGTTLPADTTTVATLSAGAPPRTVNEPTQWSVVASCGALTVTDSYPGLYLISGLSGEVTAAQAAPPKAKIADDAGSTALFPDGTCLPVLIDPGSDNGTEVSRLDPKTHRADTTWQLPDGNDGPALPEQTDFQWGPQPHGDVLAYVTLQQLYIVDLGSGTVTGPDKSPWNNAAQILGWTG